MLCFPDPQLKAQEELDRVLGGRLPDFNDESELPYISALVREVLRWVHIVMLIFREYIINIRAVGNLLHLSVCQVLLIIFKWMFAYDGTSSSCTSYFNRR